MKYRKDFVTNSSSSSFVCEICGRVDGGFDVSLYDVGMVECCYGHVFCEDEMLIISRKELVEYITTRYDYKKGDVADISDSDLPDFFLHIDDVRYDIPEKMCPICSFVEYSESDLANYLLKKYGVSTDEVFALVKQTNRRRKKLYDSEYITEVCKRFNLSPADIVAGWKDEFQTYKNFKGYIR